MGSDEGVPEVVGGEDWRVGGDVVGHGGVHSNCGGGQELLSLRATRSLMPSFCPIFATPKTFCQGQVPNRLCAASYLYCGDKCRSMGAGRARSRATTSWGPWTASTGAARWGETMAEQWWRGGAWRSAAGRVTV